MADRGPPGRGSMIIAALLVLVFVFTGMWIIRYVEPDGNPRGLFPWFLGAAAIIVVVGIAAALLRARFRRD